MDKLKEIFYDKKQGLSNLNKLYEKVQEEHLNISRKQIQDFYEKQSITKIMKPVRKPKYFNSYVANYAGHIYQLDIINYTRFKINNYQYIICLIDIYSRYLVARAMTNREMTTIIKNFNDMIDEIGPPYKLQCDNEFNKKLFIDEIQKYNIKVRFSDAYEDFKNPIVERVNGTLQTLLQRIRIITNDKYWYKYLDDALYNYNNSVHTTTHHKPIDILKGKAANEQDIMIVKYKYQEGDKVKIIEKKEVFSKIDKIITSKETYIIEKIKGNRYKLFGDDKLYKPHELSRVYDLDNENIDLSIIEPTDEAKTHKKQLKYKNIGIDENNIIEGKRERKIK